MPQNKDQCILTLAKGVLASIGLVARSFVVDFDLVSTLFTFRRANHLSHSASLLGTSSHRFDVFRIKQCVIENSEVWEGFQKGDFLCPTKIAHFSFRRS